MDDSIPQGHAKEPRATLFLFFAYLLHLAEEWIGGFSEWTRVVVGNEVSTERFVFLNAIGLLIFGAGTLSALLNPRMAWFAAAFASLLGLNGVLHLLATLGFGSYSPGLVTGLLLLMPLSVIVLKESAARLSRSVFSLSVLAGVLFHGFVSLMAFSS